MLAKRIIPCLDIKDNRTVKGINFKALKDAGDPVELARYYAENGADELVFLDITATQEKRKTLIKLVEKVAAAINIPFTVGGGITTKEAAADLIYAGADKVSINSAAVRNPDLITQIADRFGAQSVVVAIDAKYHHNNWQVFLNGGRQAVALSLFSWAQQAQQLGAGEILFTSMNHDGTKKGFANKALSKLTDLLKIPVIASGGAGSYKDFKDAFIDGKADAALAASVFHYNQIKIPELKKYLKQENIIVRI